MAIFSNPAHRPVRPSVQVTIDDSRLGASSSDSQKAVVVFGSANGGVPGTLYTVKSYPQAKSIFRGGELLDFIETAWNPSDDYRGAGVIYAMRVENATPATLIKGNVKFTSTLYGQGANKVMVRLEENDLTNTQRLVAQDASTNSVETYDNLGAIMDVQYTGIEAAAQVAIANHQMTIQVGPANDMTAVMTYPLEGGNFDNVGQIVSDINSHIGFSAELKPYGDKNIQSKYLDETTGVDIKHGPATLTSLIGDMIYQTQYSNILNVSLVTDETPDVAVSGVTPTTVTFDEVAQSSPVTTLGNFPNTALSGGSNGSVPGSWASFFNELALDDAPRAYYLVALTPNQAIHAELTAFAQSQSDAGYDMRAVVGGALGESFQKVLARQAALYSGRAVEVGFDAVRRMADGRILTMPAYMATAFVAGLASGLPVGEPITHKTISVDSLVRPYTSDQLDQLHANGVVGAEKIRNLGGSSFRIVSDVTTKNDQNDPVTSQLGLGEIADFLAMALRERLDSQFIGTAIRAQSEDRMKMVVESFFLEEKNAGMIESYSPDDINVAIVGDTANISAVVVPARGLNYIEVGLIFANNDSSTASAQY